MLFCIGYAAHNKGKTLKSNAILLAVLGCCILSACSKGLSEKEQAQVLILKAELEAAKKEVAAAVAEDAKYSGGLVKSLLAVRLELLKTNEALIEQRIQTIESGAKMAVETVASTADATMAKELEEEIKKQELKVSEAAAKSAQYSGGLVAALSSVAEATERNSLSMLRQRYLIAKHGLAFPKPGPAAPESKGAAASEAATASSRAGVSDLDMRKQILLATMTRKKYSKIEYQDFVFFDMSFDPMGLDKPTRAIKGALILTDLFGEEKFRVGWTIDKPVTPGTVYVEKGSGFKYNEFNDEHRWVLGVELENMKTVFRVDSIIYQDGTTKEFD